MDALGYNRGRGKFVVVTAGCIDTDLLVCRRDFSQQDKALIEIAYTHHAMWVTFNETRCQCRLGHQPRALQGSWWTQHRTTSGYAAQRRSRNNQGWSG